MTRVERTQESLDDVLEIWSYIAQDNPNAADKLLRQVDETIQSLAEQPDLGLAQFHYRENLRCKIVAGHYLIFYDEIPDGIRIIRVLHGARNWQQLL